MRAAAALCALLLAGCAPAPAPSTPPAPPLEIPMVELLPTPFTGAQIRDAMPVGTVVTLRTEVAGEPVVVSRWEVLGNAPEGLRLRTTELADDGSVLEGPVEDGPTPWEDLRRHAEYAVSDSTRARGTLDGPLGSLDTLVYTRTILQGDMPTVSAFHFATAIPGPPVLVTVDVDGARVTTVQMTARTGFPRE